MATINERFMKNLGARPIFSLKENKSCTVTLKLPLNEKKLLMLSICQNLLKKTVVRQIPGIEKAFIIEDDKTKEPKLQIAGINFEAFYKYSSEILLNKIYTNDIVAVLKKFGVEAARSSLIGEIKGVFGGYGI